MSEERETAIRITDLSKTYHVTNTAQDKGSGHFLALDGVSFTLYRGDVMGVIGSNGSGKSTLLKILAGVTKPGSGEARFYGTVTSILNIGDNFHPDLTGRENVLIQLKLSGIDKGKFDSFMQEIADFSEIGDFFERPVKIYSQGMFLRLAFSIAMYLSADILILDEVLSVGDEGFRLKCQEILRSFAQQGKTILFVSHSRAEVQEISTRCLWLDKGRIRKIGKPTEVLGEYFAMHRDNYDGKKHVIDVPAHDETGGLCMDWPEETAPGNEVLSIRHLSVTAASPTAKIYHSDAVQVKFVIHKKRKNKRIGAFFFVQDMFYQSVFVGHFLNNTEQVDFSRELKDETGLFEITCMIPPRFLMPGKYFLLVRFGMEENEWNAESEEAFRFSETLGFHIHPQPDYVDFIGDLSKGSVRPVLHWQTRRV